MTVKQECLFSCI